jgi:hypothetical protein
MQVELLPVAEPHQVAISGNLAGTYRLELIQVLTLALLESHGQRSRKVLPICHRDFGFLA